MVRLHTVIFRLYDEYVVWVTDRMNAKEDELADMQEKLEQYESLLETLRGSGGVATEQLSHERELLKNLYKLVDGLDSTATEQSMYEAIAKRLKEPASKSDAIKTDGSIASATPVSDEYGDDDVLTGDVNDEYEDEFEKDADDDVPEESGAVIKPIPHLESTKKDNNSKASARSDAVDDAYYDNDFE